MFARSGTSATILSVIAPVSARGTLIYRTRAFWHVNDCRPHRGWSPRQLPGHRRWRTGPYVVAAERPDAGHLHLGEGCRLQGRQWPWQCQLEAEPVLEPLVVHVYLHSLRWLGQGITAGLRGIWPRWVACRWWLTTGFATTHTSGRPTLGPGTKCTTGRRPVNSRESRV
ncbi:MAG: hypothetical protein QOE58_2319 [Actinomycetota bacterium]|nr:hypothetical protein [Actinomycetota bacterium]